MRKWWIWLPLFAGLLTAELVAAGLYGHQGQIRRFGVVRAGVLYRGGQPVGADWNKLTAEYGIRTVIDFRELDPDADWSIQQEAYCRQNGLRLVHIPMTDRSGPQPEQIEAFFTVVRDARNWPVLIHCEQGASRTGVMSAAYRIVDEGWTYQDAIDEAMRYRFPMDHNQQYDAFLRTLAQDSCTTPSLAVGR